MHIPFRIRTEGSIRIRQASHKADPDPGSQMTKEKLKNANIDRVRFLSKLNELFYRVRINLLDPNE